MPSSYFDTDMKNTSPHLNLSSGDYSCVGYSAKLPWFLASTTKYVVEREHIPDEGRQAVEVVVKEERMKAGRLTVLTISTHHELQLKAASCY